MATVSKLMLGAVIAVTSIASPALAQQISKSDPSISVHHSKYLKKAVSETALMLSPQRRGELIQERSRIIMAVEVDHKASVSSLNRTINQLTRPETHPLVAGFLLSGLLAANVAPD